MIKVQTVGMFPNNPVTNIGFGKITEIKNNFNKIRKRIDGKLCTFYVKNDEIIK